MRVQSELQPEARMLVDFCLGAIIVLVVIGAILGFLNAGLSILLDILEIFSKK